MVQKSDDFLRVCQCNHYAKYSSNKVFPEYLTGLRIFLPYSTSSITVQDTTPVSEPANKDKPQSRFYCAPEKSDCKVGENIRTGENNTNCGFVKTQY